MPAANTIFPIVARHNLPPSEGPLLGRSQTRSIEERIYSRSVVQMDNRGEWLRLNRGRNKQQAAAISSDKGLNRGRRRCSPTRSLHSALPPCLAVLRLLRRLLNVRRSARPSRSLSTRYQGAFLGTIASRQHRGKARARTPYTSIRARRHSTHSPIPPRCCSLPRPRNG